MKPAERKNLSVLSCKSKMLYRALISVFCPDREATLDTGKTDSAELYGSGISVVKTGRR